MDFQTFHWHTITLHGASTFWNSPWKFRRKCRFSIFSSFGARSARGVVIILIKIQKMNSSDKIDAFSYRSRRHSSKIDWYRNANSGPTNAENTLHIWVFSLKKWKMKAKLNRFMVKFTNLLPLGHGIVFRRYYDVQIYPRCVFVSYGPLQKLIRDFKEQNV